MRRHLARCWQRVCAKERSRRARLLSTASDSVLISQSGDGGDSTSMRGTRKRPSRQKRQRILSELAIKRDALETGASQSGLPLGLKVSAVIERTPALMPNPEPWEDAMWQLQEQLRYYDGYDYPKQVYGRPAKDADMDLPFDLAARTTQADLDGDTRSLERSLVKSLFLVVKTSDGWRFPEALLDGDEKLRHVAERAMSETIGKDLYTYMMGNAPIGMWFQTLTEDLRARSKMYGFRQYFMKAIVVDLYNTGPVILNDRICSDYAWISQDEFSQYFHEEDLIEFLGHMLAPAAV